MVKKYWLVGLTSILIIVLLLAYFFLKERFKPQTDPYKAVPTDAFFILEANDFFKLGEKLVFENQIWESLTRLNSVRKADSSIERFDSLLRSDKAIENLFENRPFLISGHLNGNQSVDLLYLTLPPGNQNIQSIRNLLEKLPDQLLEMDEKEYHRTQILEVHEADRKFRMYIASYRGILLFSPSSILVERAIRQLDLDENIVQQNGFARVRHTSGRNVEGNLYIHFNFLDQFAAMLLESPFNRRVDALSEFASWAELDVSLLQDAILLNGFAHTSDSAVHYFGLFHDQSTQRIMIDEVLPANTIAYFGMGLSDIRGYSNALQRTLSAHGKANAFEQKLEALKRAWDPDIDKTFKGLMKNEIGVAYTGIRNLTFSQNMYVLAGLVSHSQAMDVLEEALEQYYRKRSTSLENHTTWVEVDEQTRYPIFKLPVTGIPQTLFGDLFGGADHQFLTLVGNYMVFGNSTVALSNLIHNHVLQRTLSNDFDYRTFIESLSSRSNFSFYLSVPRSMDFMNRYLRENYRKNLQKEPDILRKIQAVGFQFSSEGEMVYNNVYIKYLPDYQEKAETQWESLLDSTVRSKPYFVANHYTKEKEIFLQDEQNHIYLVNEAGRILWKIQITEPILSEVYQIDYYKNGKLQYLFNTSEHIYLIDRNGNNVEHFPVILRSKAAGGLSLFDYDNTRDYRICIAGEDRNIYMLNKDGRIVKGWDMPETEALLHTPIYHFRDGNKDFIVYSDQYKMHILNRRGNTRIDVKETISRPVHQSIFIDRRRSGTRFITTNEEGTIYIVNLDGKAVKKTIKTFSKNHFFDYSDLDGNGSDEFIFVDGNRLEVYKFNGDPVFSYKFEEEITMRPSLYTFSSNDKKIGVVSDKEREIYLFNNDGQLYTNFPLRGQTLFSIGRFHYGSAGYSLIVGGDDNFLYHYSVK
jgi:hypothetical protein